ncbi:hypothetical protein OK074_6972 [Actinobacteria bacterium OK074]|nr:hypothetical protein OK074_6972 [Actinobacteria bacterium OK074]
MLRTGKGAGPAEAQSAGPALFPFSTFASPLETRMTTVTLPTTAPPPPDAPGTSDAAGGPLPRPGHYAVAPGRSLVELTAWYGPLPTLRRRIALASAALTVPEDSEPAAFRFEFTDPRLPDDTVLSCDHAEPLGPARLQLLGDIRLSGTDFPALLTLRVVERADDRLLVVGTARLPHRLLHRATGFRYGGRLRPATRLRLLVAGEFTAVTAAEPAPETVAEESS